MEQNFGTFKVVSNNLKWNKKKTSLYVPEHLEMFSRPVQILSGTFVIVSKISLNGEQWNVQNSLKQIRIVKNI